MSGEAGQAPRRPVRAALHHHSHGHRPARVTTDLHPAYRKAIRWILGRKVLQRPTQYLNNLTEQSDGAVARPTSEVPVARPQVRLDQCRKAVL